jgi:hypothetical protein
MIRMGNARRALRRIRSLTMLCGLLSVFSLTLGLSSSAAEMTDSVLIDLSSYEGHWRRIDDSEADAARLSAIDRAIDNLSWIVRTMAAGVLRKTTTPPPEMEFVWDGERLHQGLQGQDMASSRPVLLDGKQRSGEDMRGVPFSWVWAWTDVGLRVNWEQHQARGNNVYRIDEHDGRTLVVEHTINVTAISNIEPIVYLSRFSRTEVPPQVAAGRSDADQGRSE